MVGKTIAHYEITAKLGEGGRGVVHSRTLWRVGGGRRVLAARRTP